MRMSVRSDSGLERRRTESFDPKCLISELRPMCTSAFLLRTGLSTPRANNPTPSLSTLYSSVSLPPVTPVEADQNLPYVAAMAPSR